MSVMRRSLLASLGGIGSTQMSSRPRIEEPTNFSNRKRRRSGLDYGANLIQYRLGRAGNVKRV